MLRLLSVSAFAVLLVIAQTLPPNWVSVQTDDGEEYFWNTDTGETSWTRPGAAAEPDSWSVEVDPSTGQTFYYNTASGESTWDMPEELRVSNDGANSQPDHLSLVEIADDEEAQCKSFVQARHSESATGIGIVVSDYGASDPTPLTIQWAGTGDKSFLVERASVAVVRSVSVPETIREELLASFSLEGSGNCAEAERIEKELEAKRVAEAAAREEAERVRQAAEKEEAEKAAIAEEKRRIEEEESEKAAAEEKEKAEIAAQEKIRQQEMMAQKDEEEEKSRIAEREAARKAALSAAAEKASLSEEEQFKSLQRAAKESQATKPQRRTPNSPTAAANSRRDREKIVPSVDEGHHEKREERDSPHRSPSDHRQQNTDVRRQQSTSHATSILGGSDGSVNTEPHDNATVAVLVDSVWGLLLDAVISHGDAKLVQAARSSLTSAGSLALIRSSDHQFKNFDRLLQHFNLALGSDSQLTEDVQEEPRESTEQTTHADIMVTVSNVQPDPDPDDLSGRNLASRDRLEDRDESQAGQHRSDIDATMPAATVSEDNAEVAMNAEANEPEHEIKLDDDSSSVVDGVWTFEFSGTTSTQGIDTNHKEKGDDALVHLVQHSTNLASALNSGQGFSFSLVSKPTKDKRPYSHAPLYCGQNPTRDQHLGISIGHKKSDAGLELRVSDGKKLLVHTFSHDPVPSDRSCNRTITSEVSQTNERIFSLWVDGKHCGSVEYKNSDALLPIYDAQKQRGCWLGDVWGWKFAGDVMSFSIQSLGSSVSDQSSESRTRSDIEQHDELTRATTDDSASLSADNLEELAQTDTAAQNTAQPIQFVSESENSPKELSASTADQTVVSAQDQRTLDKPEDNKDRIAEKPNKLLDANARMETSTKPTPAGAVPTIMGYLNRATNDEGEKETFDAVPDHEALKQELARKFNWNITDISTWIKRWGSATAKHGDNVDATVLAAAEAAKVAAAAAEEAQKKEMALNGTQKFLVLQSVAFRKSLNMDDKHKSGGVKQGTVVAGIVRRLGDDLGDENISLESAADEAARSNLSIVNSSTTDDLWLEVLNPEGVGSATQKGTASGSGKRNKRSKRRKKKPLTEKQKRKLAEKEAAAAAAEAERAAARYFIPVRVEGLLAVVEHGTPERHFIVEESVAFRSKPEWGAKIPGGVRDGDLVRMISGCEVVDSGGVTWIQSLEGSWLPLKNKKGEVLLKERDVRILQEEEAKAAEKAAKEAEKQKAMEEGKLEQEQEKDTDSKEKIRPRKLPPVLDPSSLRR